MLQQNGNISHNWKKREKNVRRIVAMKKIDIANFYVRLKPGNVGM